MAQRLILQRVILSLSGRNLISQVRTSSGLLASSTGLKSTALPRSRFGGLTSAHQICTSPLCKVTFNVQSKGDFQERVIGSDTPVVVDFHAQWCGPCKILAPRLEKAVAKHQGKVLMAKVDIDEHTDLAIEYEVNAVPTVIALKNGDVVAQFVGLKDEDHVEAFLNKLIGPCP